MPTVDRTRGGRVAYTPGAKSAAIAARSASPFQSQQNSISFERQIPVNAAYQKLMRYGQETDLSTQANRRNLATNLDTSKKNRGSSLLNSRQGLADRGMMNSGIALKRMEELNQGYDTTDNQMQGNFDRSLADIARQKLGLEQDYKDSVVQGSYLTAQDKTAAEDARLQATLAREEASAVAWREEQQRNNLIAAMQAQIQAPQQAQAMYQEPLPVAAPPVVDTSYADAANAYMAALARNKRPAPRPRAGTRGIQ